MSKAKTQLNDAELLVEYLKFGTEAVRPIFDKISRGGQVLIITPRNIQVSLDRLEALENVGTKSFSTSPLRSEAAEGKRFVTTLRNAEKEIIKKGTNVKLAKDIYQELLALLNTGEFQNTRSIKHADNTKIIIAGTFKTIQRVKKRMASSASIGTAAGRFITGTQIGHTHGVVAEMANRVLDEIEQLSGVDSTAKLYIRSLASTVLRLEGNTTYLKRVNRSNTAKIEVLHTLEYSFYNRAMGIMSKSFSVALRRELVKAIEKSVRSGTSNALTNKYAKLLSSPGSMSFEDMIAEALKQNFLLKGKPKNQKSKTKVKNKKQAATPIKASSRTKQNTRDRKSKKAKPTTLFGNLMQLQNLINLRLHETLKEKVMGQGDDPVFLNYQTGRFARSAHLNMLTPMKGGLEADITWQHYPYDTFAPGGRRHTPARDPNFLIGQSIREIVKDLGLQQLNISTKAGR